MKNVWKLSIAANLVFAGLVVWLLGSSRSDTPHPPAPPVQFETPPPEAPAAPPASPERIPVAPAFHWGQLESTNYRTYVANLRGVECPEQTIRDIITADVDESFYAPRREQLRQGGTAHDVESALQELNGEEAAFIDSLLGTRHPVSEVAADTTRVPRIHVESRAERELKRPVSMPLALQLVDSGATNLTDAQMQTVKEIRQNFLSEMGGTNQDPNDPAYRQRWQAAQRNADDMLGALLGSRFVLELKNQASQPQ